MLFVPRAGIKHAPAAAAYSPNGVVYDGTNDYGTRTSALTGAADAKTLAVAFAFKPNLANTLQRILDFKTVGSSNVGFIEFTAGNNLRIFWKNASLTTILDAESSVTLPTGSWYAVAISVDLANASNRQIMINGTDRFPGTPDTYTDDTMLFTSAHISIGATDSGGGPLDGELADLWFEDGRYVDFSVGANLAKFYDGSDCLVGKGSDGSTPFSAEPTFYLGDDNDEANWFTDNTSNNNDFTENGDLTNSSADPCGA